MAECNTPVFKVFDGVENWNHFLRSLCGKFAQFQSVQKVLKCVGGSTKELYGHLKSMHQIDIQAKRRNFEILESDPQTKRTKIYLGHFKSTDHPPPIWY